MIRAHIQYFIRLLKQDTERRQEKLIELRGQGKSAECKSHEWRINQNNNTIDDCKQELLWG